MQQKVSKRAVLREATKLYDENQGLKKECQQLLQMLFGAALKLYKIDPADDMFKSEEDGGSFKNGFLDAIKQAAEDKPPPPEVLEGKSKRSIIQEEMQSHKDANQDDAPERGITIEEAS